MEIKWQTIDSAPRDGSVFDVWVEDFGGYRFADVSMTKEGVIRRAGSTVYSLPSWPTHWMPLPNPPEVVQDAG